MKRKNFLLFIIVGALFIGISFFISCDTGIPFPSFSFREKNISFSETPINKFRMSTDGYFLRQDSRYFTVLEIERVGELPPSQDFDYIFICFDEIPKGKKSIYEFRAGLKILVYDVFLKIQNMEPTISRIARLDEDGFFAEPIGKSIRLVYRSKILEKSLVGIIGDEQEYWIQFDVRAKQNSEKVISVIKELYPLLQKEPESEEVIKYFKPLLDKSTKQYFNKGRN